MSSSPWSAAGKVRTAKPPAGCNEDGVETFSADRCVPNGMRSPESNHKLEDGLSARQEKTVSGIHFFSDSR